MTSEGLLSDPSIVWFQRFELADGVTTPGHHDIEQTMARAGVPLDQTGERVLDIGTCNGGAAFIAERRGAKEVLAVDIFEPNLFGFTAIADSLNSRATFQRATVYELPNVVPHEFDRIFFFGVLYHLRHPLLALDALREIAAGTVHIETAVNARPKGIDFFPDAYAGDTSNWFIPSDAAVLDWLHSSGFDAEQTDAWSDGTSHRASFAARRSRGLPSWRKVSYELPVSATVDWSAADEPRD